LSGGKYTSIEYPNAAGNDARGITDSAEIVGNWSSTGTDVHGYYTVKQ
jgi:hypothetical protein